MAQRRRSGCALPPRDFPEAVGATLAVALSISSISSILSIKPCLPLHGEDAMRYIADAFPRGWSGGRGCPRDGRYGQYGRDGRGRPQGSPLQASGTFPRGMSAPACVPRETSEGGECTRPDASGENEIFLRSSMTLCVSVPLCETPVHCFMPSWCSALPDIPEGLGRTRLCASGNFRGGRVHPLVCLG